MQVMPVRVCADASVAALEAEQLEAEAKLAKVKKAKDAAAAAFASMKASGLGGIELNRCPILLFVGIPHVAHVMRCA